MERFTRAWLLVNPASGSNRETSVDELRQCLADSGVEVERTIVFPDDPLPTLEALNQAADPLLVTFAGDGTTNAAVSALEGWSGAILVLPGGTMNLLAKRLHGDLQAEAIVPVLANGLAMRCRPNVIRTQAGMALAGLLVGPGTCWSEVREAMRDFDIAGFAGGAIDALSQTAEGPPVYLRDPEAGRREGYPLIEMTPGQHGIQLDGYIAETAGDFAKQGWALMRRRFREGPHDRLGIVAEVELASIDGSPLSMLLDGEPVEASAAERFAVAPCGVDLLATGYGD